MEKDKLIKSFENCLSSGGCDNCPSGKEHRVFIDRAFVLTCRSLTKETLNILKNSVEVVRCKDCKFWTPMDDGISWKNKGRTDGECEMLLKRHYSARIWTKQDHFCSYGERKDS